MTEKKSFILYYSINDIIDKLDDHQIADLFRAILATGGVREMPELDPLTDLAFTPIKRELMENAEKWQKTRAKRAEAGSRGGKKKAEKAKLANANKEEQHLANVANTSNAKQGVANLANVAVDDDVDVDVDVDVVNNISIVQNEPELTDESDASPLCSADAEPVVSAQSTSGPTDSRRPAKPSKKAVDEHFEALWALFPNKRGKQQVSDKTRRKLMAISVEQMRVAVGRYMAEYEAAQPGRSMLNGSTWFTSRYYDYIGDNYEPTPSVQHTLKPSARSQQTQYRAPSETRDFSALEE